MPQSRQSASDSSRGRKPGLFSQLLLLLLASLAATATGLFLASIFNTTIYLAEDRLMLNADAISQIKAMSSQDRAQLKSGAQHRLSEEPLDVAALKTLSRVHAAEGNAGKSQEYTLQAATRSLRDVEVQLDTVRILLEQKKYERAAYHLDGLLRAKPELGDKLYLPFYYFADTPDTLGVLVSVLGKSPPWRASFVKAMMAAENGEHRGYALLQAMRKAGQTVPTDEMRTYISTVVAKGMLDRAQLVFLEFLNDDELIRAKNVFDGGFSLEPRNLVFDWTLQQQRNMKLQIVPKPGSAMDRSLLVDLYAYDRQFDHVSQLLRLQPGPYSLSFEFNTDNVKSGGGLQWSAQCLENGQLIMASSALKQNAPWSEESVQFVVPEEGCDTQRLALQSAGRTATDRKITGKYYFDNVSIIPKLSP